MRVQDVCAVNYGHSHVFLISVLRQTDIFDGASELIPALAEADEAAAPAGAATLLSAPPLSRMTSTSAATYRYNTHTYTRIHIYTHL